LKPPHLRRPPGAKGSTAQSTANEGWLLWEHYPSLSSTRLTASHIITCPRLQCDLAISSGDNFQPSK